MSLNAALIDAAVAALAGSPWIVKGHEYDVAKSVVDGLAEQAIGDEYRIERRSDFELFDGYTVHDGMVTLTRRAMQHGGPIAHTTLTQHTNDGRCCIKPVLHDEPRG